MKYALCNMENSVSNLQRVAIFVANYSVDNSPSIINLLKCLTERYQVDLVMRAMGLTDNSVLRDPVLRVIDAGKLSWQQRQRLRARALVSPYRSVIAIEPHGFVLCQTLLPWVRPFYYSLELYMKNDHFGLTYPQEVMEKERSAIHRVRGLLIQSREKERLFRADYNLANDIPAFLLPVTYQGKSNRERLSIVRDRYGLHGKKIALHLGGIAGWHSCIEMALAFAEIPGWALVFHGFGDPKYRVLLQETIAERQIKNVFVSEETFVALDDIDDLIRSCDLGIAWYNDISIGFRTAGRSSGKIPAYFRFGLPVIAKRYASTMDAIVATGCGICIDESTQLSEALDTIAADYDRYSKRALSEYDNVYRFDLYETSLLEFLHL